MRPTFRWRPSSLFSCQFVRATGWLPSIWRKRTSRFRFIPNLVHFYALCPRVTFSSSKLCAWPIHGSSGLLSGHGSCFRHSPRYGCPHAQISGRLASPVIFSGVPSQGSPDSPRALPWVRGGDQPGEIPSRPIPGGAVSRCSDQHPVFCGFSIARSHFQAAVNRRRISILRLASREVMALSAGNAFFAGSPGSWRQTADAVSPAVPQSLLGSRWSLGSCGLDSELSLRSPVVAPPASPLPGCVPLPGVSQPRLLVRRLGRRVGCSSGSPRRFRPLGLPTGVSIHKRQGAAGHPARFPPLSVVSAPSYSHGILRQCHCGGVSPQGRRHQVSFAEHHSSGDSVLVGVSSHPSGSTVYPGLQQRPGGCSVSPSPAASFQVVPQHDRISIFMSSVAGPNRFVCDLRQSSLLDLFLSLPGSSVGGHGRLPPVLGRSTGLRLSSICHHSQSPREAPGISGDGAHHCGSTLGSAILVSGSPPAVAGTSGHPSRSSRPPAPASLSAPLPGSPQATASCLETLRRFTRAAGFSSAVAEQSSLARRLPAPLVCLLILVPFSWPFRLSPFVGEGGWLPHLVVVVQRRLFHPWLPLDVVCGLPLPPTILVLGSGAAWPPSLLQALLCGASFTPSCLGLSQGFTLSQLVSFRAFIPGFPSRSVAKGIFSVGPRYGQTSWWVAGSFVSCHLCGFGCLSLLHTTVCRQVEVAHTFHPSLLLG